MPPPPTPAGPAGRASPVLPIVLISAIFVFGVDAMIGQIIRNGYVDFASSLLADDGRPHFLPGTNRLILRHFVGVPAVDRFLATANVFWANVADGSRLELSLFTFFFGTQLVGFFTVFIIESQRVARRSSLLFNPLVWGFLMQTFGYGIAAPVFFALHLAVTSRSRLVDTVRLRDPTSLHSIVPAFALGYFALCLFLVYPYSQGNVRQWTNAVWQTFPLHVVVWQAIITAVVKRTSLGQDAFTSKIQLDRRALTAAYGFAWNAAVVGQVGTSVAFLLSWSKFIPAHAARAFAFGPVFIPGLPHTSTPMTSPAAVVHNYFQYDLYVGSAVAVIWAVYLLSEVSPVLSTAAERKKLARGIAWSVWASGPGGALVALMRHRDELVLAAELKAERSQ